MSQPPEHPASPADRPGGEQNPKGYPPPNYGTPPPNYGTPPPGYGTAPGYGAAPPGYPAQPGYGVPAQQAFSVGDAFNWAWKKFTDNALALIVATLVYGLLIGAVNALIFIVNPGSSTSNGSYTWDTANLSPAQWAFLIVAYIAVYALSIFAEGAIVTGCLDIADGRPVTIGSFFRPRNLGMVVLAALLLGVITAAASVVCFIPGLIFEFFAMFTIPFVVDRSQPAVQAMTSSFSVTSSNIGDSLLSWLVQAVVMFVGLLACVVGLLVAAPVAALILIYTYRKLSGGQVVPLQQPTA